MEINNQNYLRNTLRLRYNMNDFLRQQVEKIPPNGRVLDMGCGDLDIVKQIQAMRPDLRLEGIDIRELPAESRTEKIGFTRIGVGEYAPGYEFDFILAIAVLEHLPQPETLLIQAHKLLKPGGRLFINVPSVTQLFLLGDQNFYSDYTHIRPFSGRGMKRILLDFGFEIEVLDTQANTGIRHVPKFIYRLCRGVFRGDPIYINSALLHIGGGCVEAVGRKPG
jgi:predicted TPR repeat methyltransferase